MDRAATAGFVNAIARNRGQQRFVWSAAAGPRQLTEIVAQVARVLDRRQAVRDGRATDGLDRPAETGRRPFRCLRYPERTAGRLGPGLSHSKRAVSLRGSGPAGRNAGAASGGPLGVVDQRAERDSPAGQQTNLLVFVLSGFASLIYEVAWARQLVLGFGTTAEPISAILAGDWCCCGRHAPSA